MSKITLTNLANLQNETTAVNAINSNNAVLMTALDNTLSRDGTAPNQMQATLDMNSNHIINLPTPTSNYDPVRLIDVSTINGGGITVSPLPAGGTTGQLLQKLSSADFDSGWKTVNTIPVVSPEEFGYTTYGTGDAGIAIANAIASVAGPVSVQLGNHTYNVVTPIVVNKDGVSITGLGEGSVLQFTPAVNGTLLKFSAVATPNVINGVYLRDFKIYSADTIHTKIGINLVDVRGARVENIAIGGTGSNGSWSGVGSVGFQTNGRDTSEFGPLNIAADGPIVMGKSPSFANGFLSADHLHFHDCYLVAGATFPSVEALNGTDLTNVIFDGFQAWALSTHGFYWNDTLSTGQRSSNILFQNVRIEQGSDNTAYNFYLNSNTGCVNFIIDNCQMDVGRKGVFARKIQNLKIKDSYYPAVAAPGQATEGYNVDNTCDGFIIDNCRWESATTVVNTGMAQVYRMNGAPGTSSAPQSAMYSLNNGIQLGVLASTSLGLLGATSGTTTIQPNAVASGTITVPNGTDTLVGRATTDTLTNKSLTSPTLTGTPVTPTAAQDTNTTQVASTAYVVGQAGAATPIINGSATVGTSLRYSRQDHVHPTDTSRQAADPQLFSNIPQNSQSAPYTLVLTDGEKHIFHPSADTTARTWTIPANASVAYPIGTAVTFVNQNAGGVITIAITTDTLRLAGAGTTGSRSLAANGIATALKVTSTEWIISGTGLS